MPLPLEGGRSVTLPVLPLLAAIGLIILVTVGWMMANRPSNRQRNRWAVSLL